MLNFLCLKVAWHVLARFLTVWRGCKPRKKFRLKKKKGFTLCKDNSEGSSFSFLFFSFFLCHSHGGLVTKRPALKITRQTRLRCGGKKNSDVKFDGSRFRFFLFVFPVTCSVFLCAVCHSGMCNLYLQQKAACRSGRGDGRGGGGGGGAPSTVKRLPVVASRGQGG